MALKVFDAVPDLAQGLATQNADFIRKTPGVRYLTVVAVIA